MSPLLLLSSFALLPEAGAASLDLLEVGGAFGSPAATNPTALWWNPAGLAVAGGTQFFVEGAPTLAKVTVNRTNPDYGQLPPPLSAEFPTEYDYGGTEDFTFNGVVPFLGVSSDLGVKGLGVGLGLMVPTARGATSQSEDGPNRYAIRAGSIQALHLTAAAAYQLKDKVALGASASFVDGSYYASTDTTTYPDLAWGVAEELGFEEPPASFQNGYTENLGYSTNAIFGGEENGKHGVLKDSAFTFGAGVHVTPLKKERLLDIAVSYNHGLRLETKGDLTMKFQCAPSYDGISRFAGEDRGLCNGETGEGSVLKGDGRIAFDLPSRVQLGISSSPIDALRLEVMGAYVFWSAFTDFEIGTTIKPDAIPVDDPEKAQASADLVTQERNWARDNRDTFWLGLDGKYQFNKYFGAGARVMYDRAAVPDAVVSANNIDNDTIMLTGLVMVNPIERLGLGFSAGQYFLAKRTITNSAYAVDLEGGNPAGANYYAATPDAGRYFFPSSNGTYTGRITRLGVSVRGTFGRKDGLPSW
jgi:long-subunit fatty acid transport protein